MNYLALDQSLNITGWAVFKDEILMQYGTFNIKASKPIEQRLHEIHNQLTKLNSLFENIDYVFFEDIQYQNNKETFKKLAYVQSQILTWCYWNDKKFSILSPSHWRKIITDNYKIKFGRTRAEQKKTCYDFVTDFWNINPKDITEDAADAIALGMAGIIEKETTNSDW